MDWKHKRKIWLFLDGKSSVQEDWGIFLKILKIKEEKVETYFPIKMGLSLSLLKVLYTNEKLKFWIYFEQKLQLMDQIMEFLISKMLQFGEWY